MNLLVNSILRNKLMYLQYLSRKEFIRDSVDDRNSVISDERRCTDINGNAITAFGISKQIYRNDIHNRYSIFNKVRHGSENEMIDCITDIPDSLVTLRNQYLAKTAVNRHLP